ncbi:hypothetical protein N7495_008612 [Penicillium taxi]|uniref:uncharacterized protein n=1 Tax=Penicillium taxi TaxID=168475 RepID=UPI0025454853|nr:uncharacterized protein N7495_008612 [Penicillium taxi]KAJ5888571.1 hypothetical protein N7495_008612 [Penicillium taxi]
MSSSSYLKVSPTPSTSVQAPSNSNISPTPSSSDWTVIKSVNDFDTVEAFEQHFFSSLSGNNQPYRFVFTEVPHTWGRRVFNAVDDETFRVCQAFNPSAFVLSIKTMPSFVHNTYQSWIKMSNSRWERNNLLTIAESDRLSFETGTTLKFANGSIKEPDLFFHDSKWAAAPHCGHRSGQKVCTQTETISPRPANGQNQQVILTRAEIFGPDIFPGSFPDTSFDLLLDQLRGLAVDRLAIMTGTPA